MHDKQQQEPTTSSSPQPTTSDPSTEGTKLPRSRILRSRLGAAWRRSKKPLALGALLVGLGAGTVSLDPISTVGTSELVVRTFTLTGGTTQLRQGAFLAIPGLHRVARYPLADQSYRPSASAHAQGPSPYQSLEGLSFGAELSIRYALEVSAIDRLPVAAERVGVDLVDPVIDGAVRRIFAKHTVREIFSSQREAVENEIAQLLAPTLKENGVVLKAVTIGGVDLPDRYRAGLEELLAEELANDKMRFTLELKDKEIKEKALEAEADKVRQEKQAEALGAAEVIAAKARAEAMQHILPFKEKEIEQRRLEAEAAKVARILQAEADAQARRIEAEGEADSRRKLADSEAYRTEVVAKAQSEAMARDSRLIAQNPLLIQKTLADKLSDKISVIIAPPQAGGFFADRLLGTPSAPQPQTVALHAQAAPEEEN
ncbi:MAG: SPFH domain-containing protein [Myxococcota bacterium]